MRESRPKVIGRSRPPLTNWCRAGLRRSCTRPRITERSQSPPWSFQRAVTESGINGSGVPRVILDEELVGDATTIRAVGLLWIGAPVETGAGLLVLLGSYDDDPRAVRPAACAEPQAGCPYLRDQPGLRCPDGGGWGGRASRKRHDRGVRALLVIADRPLANTIDLTLQYGRYVRRVAETINDAKAAIAEWKPHLLLVDVDTEAGAGMQLIDEARNHESIGVIALTRRSDLRGKLEAFERGGRRLHRHPVCPGRPGSARPRGDPPDARKRQKAGAAAAHRRP